MKNKFNIGDNVRYYGLEYEVMEKDLLTDVYRLKGEIDETSAIGDDLELIQDTEEETQTITIDISKACDNLTEEEKEVLDNFKGFDKIEPESLEINGDGLGNPDDMKILGSGEGLIELAKKPPTSEPSLDYEKEYYVSMSKYGQMIEKYADLEELYEGAKMAIKLLSELLPSKYEE